MKKISLICFVFIVVISSGAVLGATIDVTQPVYCTENSEYDRNPSIIYDGSSYWLFYAKGDDVSTDGVRGPGYNPDGDTYVVYYQTAASIEDLALAPETELTNSAPPNRPSSFDQRVVSATLFDGEIYTFVSSGQSGTDRGLYYYVYDGISWSGPSTLIADAETRGGHVNITSDINYIYIVWESSDGSSDCYTWDGVNLSSKIDISNGNMPKITLMQDAGLPLGVLFVVNIEDGTGDIEVFSAITAPNPLFNPHSTAIPGGGLYDPCIFNDGTDLYVISAPWVPADRQYLIQARFDGDMSTWSDAKVVSYGGYGDVEWWEYWPCGYFDGTDKYFFLTTETSGSSYSDGEIAIAKMDWDLANNHYFYIQNAVDQGAADDIINVGAGNYEEQLEINKPLMLAGSGKDVTIVQSPAVLTEFFITGTNENYPVIYIHDEENVAVQNLTVDGLARGDDNYRFIGIGFWNAGGSVNDIRITGVRDEPFSGAQHGVGVYAYNSTGGPYSIDIGGVDIDDFQKTAMALSGSGLTVNVDDCTTQGVGPTGLTAQNGIQVGFDATGSVTNCEVWDIFFTGEYWAASGILIYYPGAGIVLNGNEVYNCQGALNAYFSDGISMAGNTFDLNDFVYIWGGDGGTATGNYFTNNVEALYIADATNLNSNGNSFDNNDVAVIIDGLADNILFDGNDIINSTTAAVSVQPYDLDEPANVVFNSNNISGNGYGIDNTTADMVDARGNWWGDASGPSTDMLLSGLAEIGLPPPSRAFLPESDVTNRRAERSFSIDRTTKGDSDESIITDGSGDPVSALVDYSPWWGENYVGDPHTSPWNWYVDNSNNSTIQEGVDIVSEDDIVNITAGAYEEQVVIDKNISVIGAGQETTEIQSPVSLTEYFTTSDDNYPIVLIRDAEEVNIEDLTVDGLGRGNTNYRFVGIGFWNAGGSVDNVHLTGVRDEPFSGAQHGVSIYAFNNTGGPYTINATSVEIDDMQKTGIVMGGDGLTANVSNCTVTGQGPTSVTAQNGIQISHGAGGTVSSCTVSDIAYTGGGWVASGMLLYNGTTVDVTGSNSISNCQGCIIFQETQGSVVGASITPGSVDYAEGISIRDYGVLLGGVDDEISSRPISIIPEDRSSSGDMLLTVPTSVTIDNTTLTGVGYAGSYGIAAWSLGDDVDVDVSNSEITGWEIGIVAYEDGSGVDVTAMDDKIYGNDLGFWTNAALIQAAESNWWGATCGPYHPVENPYGEGNEVSDNVDFQPWCNEDFSRCDFPSDPVEVWVDASYAPGGYNDGHDWCYDAFDRIQNGVRAVADGGTVNVAPGTYREQIKIEGKDLELSGAGIGVSVIEAVELEDRNPYSIVQWTGGSRTIDACVGIVDAGNVDISGFTVDGRELGPNNFYGIHFFNADGSVTDCSIENIIDASGPGNDRVVSIVATHGVGGSFDVNLSDNIVPNFQKGGIVIMGPDGVCTLNNNDVNGSVNPSLAPNGIQVSFGSTGSLTGNSVSGVGYPGEDWAGTCILLFECDNVDVIGGDVEGCEVGIGHSQWNWIYTPLETPIIVVDDVALDDNKWSVSTHVADDGVTLDLEVMNCTITNALYIGVELWGSDQDPWGGDYYSGWTNGTLDVNIHDNHITNCDVGIEEYVELATGNTVNCTANRNDFSGYTEYGVYNNFTNMLDAMQCYWGDAAGPMPIGEPGDGESTIMLTSPYAPSDHNPANDPSFTIKRPVDDGLALDGVTPNVDYSPWWGEGYVDDDHSSVWKWYVDTSNSSSIQEGIDLAFSGDTVFATAAVYSGEGNKEIDFTGKSIVLTSSESPENTIIDCELSGRAFHFHNGETEDAVVNGFTIKNGFPAAIGGAIKCLNSSPTISHNVMTGNSASLLGGAIFCSNSNPLIVNNTVTGNVAYGYLGLGGGLYCLASSPTVTNTIFWANAAPGGSDDIHVESGSPSITYCDIPGGWEGVGNIDADPLFRDPVNGDFHLMSTACDDPHDSPCIDAGDPMIIDKLLDCSWGLGTVRSDMGAYGGGEFAEIPPCIYIPGDCDHNGTPLELGDVIAMIGMYRGTVDPYYTCDCPPHGEDFAPEADPNGNCVVFELGDVVTEIAAYRGAGSASGCEDCPGQGRLLPGGDRPLVIPALNSKIKIGRRGMAE